MTYPNDAAGLLLYKMRELSEDRYCAGWMSEIEYDLWWEITGRGARGYHVPPDEAQDWYDLAQRAGVWWAWDGEARRTVPVPLSEWRERFKEWASKHDGGAT